MRRGMLAVYRELEGSAQLLAHAIRRIGVLRVRRWPRNSRARSTSLARRQQGNRAAQRLHRHADHRVRHQVLNADAALAVKMLLWVVLREVDHSSPPCWSSSEAAPR